LLSLLILYLPESQLLFIGGDIMGERWMYLPTIGIAIAMGYLFTKLYELKKFIAISIFFVIITLYVSVIIPRNLVWRNAKSFFESMVRDSPKSIRGYSGLAQYYFERGMHRKALEMVNKGLTISNQEPNLYVVAASIAYAQNDFIQAEELIRKALNLDTFSTSAVLNFPRILFAQKKYEEALVWFEEYVMKLPKSSIKSQEKLLYASILSKLGKYEESNLYIFSELLADIEQSHVAILLATNYYQLGDVQKALQYFENNIQVSGRQKIDYLKKLVESNK